MKAADAIRLLATVPAPLLQQLGPIPHAALTAITTWLDGIGDEPAELGLLPDTLKSELALARAEVRAKGGAG
jgi:hypothetical protein